MKKKDQRKYYNNENNKYFLDETKRLLLSAIDIHGLDKIFNLLKAKIEDERERKKAVEIITTLFLLRDAEKHLRLSYEKAVDNAFDIDFEKMRKEKKEAFKMTNDGYVISSEVFNYPGKKAIEAQGEYSKRRSCYDEAKAIFDAYILKISNASFLKLLSEITYLFTDFNFNELIKELKNNAGYFKKVIKDNPQKTKGRRKGIAVKELVDSLCGEDVPGKIKEDDDWMIKRHGVRDRISINLDEEIDTCREEQGSECFIETLRDCYSDFPRILPDDERLLRFNDKKITLQEYYKEKIALFDKKLFTSKDLLDKIFVAYVIKRAQSGDLLAHDKLFNCYKKEAERVASNFSKNGEEIGVSEGGNFSKENIKAVALEILSLLIRGDSPIEIYKNIDNKGHEKTDCLNKKNYDICSEGLGVSMLESNYFIVSIISKSKEFKNLLKNWRNRIKKTTKEKTILEYSAKIIDYSLYYFEETGMDSSFLSNAFNPHLITTISPKYNKRCYKPNKKSSFSLYVFGDHAKGKNVSRPIRMGMLWCTLNDWYKSKTYSKNGNRHLREKDFKDVEYNDEINYSEAGARNREENDCEFEDT